MRFWFIAAGLTAVALSAQTNPAALAARDWRQKHELPIIQEFFDLLSTPNVSSDRAGTRKTAQQIVQMYAKHGVTMRLIEFPNANPIVFGEIRTPGASRTIALYAHYDGQPLDPKEWVTPPFEPTLRDGLLERDSQVIPFGSAVFPINPEYRIYARSASDDKAPIVAIATALDALRAASIKLR